jgi:hypothetical protein
MKLAIANFPEFLTHSDEGIPGCDNVSLGRSIVTFQSTLLPQFHATREFLPSVFNTQPVSV